VSTNLKVSAAPVATSAAVVAAFFFLGRPDPQASADDGVQLVREGSHRHGEPGTGDVTLVEWLDVECESCLAAYPFIERLREDYAGRVTLVARYVPMPGHPNAENAALAVEPRPSRGSSRRCTRLLHFPSTPTWYQYNNVC
jgi:hypothetical protein